ncbi:signal peptidase I [Pseudomonas tohonis]|uniref:signal peptidase I n=1 Tax=Pseudomonas tohonis TaxID=2725477 RepID=UPI0021D90A22|nr:signal peptidase I [Pseudomonas tohonis]UXY52865.1 signal peptidase I [Pseudomonas tohonis]
MALLTMLQHCISFLLNLLLPGAGFAYRGRLGMGLLFQLGFYLGLSVLVLSRLILQPAGWYALAALSASIVVASVACGLGLSRTAGSLKKRSLSLAVFILFSIGCMALTLICKQTLLGIQVYFVPSPSMTPTLQPGDFILMDTWAYTHVPPATGDIVVFQQGDDFAVVKRSANWPGTESAVMEGHLYVLGDNPGLSTDSRKLGGIDLSKVNGRVHLKLVSWSATEERWYWHLAEVD